VTKTDDLALAGLLHDIGKFEAMTKTRNTAFLYRLLELTQMSRNIKDNPENAMWRSRLSYTFRRNIFKKLKSNEDIKMAESLLNTVGRMIQNHPGESKMILSEFIYKKRRINA